MIQRRTLLVAAPTVLLGCSTMSSGVDGAALGPNQGVLALRLGANRSGMLSFMPFGETSVGDRIVENMLGPKERLFFKEGEDRYYVLPVDAGSYRWSRIDSGNQYAVLRNSTYLRVAAGKITYVGHVRISVLGGKFMVRVTDREEEMREHLEANFPNYSKSMDFQKSLAEIIL